MMEGQMSLSSISPPEMTVAASNADWFGCCSSYRRCSDAGKCLGDLNHPPHCLYRLQLETGKIFYNKNADGFSPDLYQEILSHVDALPADAQGALDQILLDLCELNRGADRMIVRREAGASVESTGLFTIHPLGEDFPRLCSAAALKALVKDNKDLAIRYKDVKEQRKAEIRALKEEIEALKEKIKALKTKGARPEDLPPVPPLPPGPQTKEFLENWLNHKESPSRDEMASPYRWIVIAPKMARYVEELYRDRLEASYDEHIYALSPLDEDGLRMAFETASADERRVRLSPGYTKEEKARRLDEIGEARRASRAEQEGGPSDAAVDREMAG